VAEDEQHNSSEEAGGHFPFLHFQAALDSAREIQARLNTQGIHSKLEREQSYHRLTTAELRSSLSRGRAVKGPRERGA
jgi:hypothetical protein